jgi:hypothetical protein
MCKWTVTISIGYNPYRLQVEDSLYWLLKGKRAVLSCVANEKASEKKCVAAINMTMVYVVISVSKQTTLLQSSIVWCNEDVPFMNEILGSQPTQKYGMNVEYRLEL